MAKITLGFKLLFIAGLVLLFVSFFLDWYTFQVFNGGNQLIASWNYNLITEWNTSLLKDNTFNELVKPRNLNVPITIIIITFIILLISGYGIIAKDVEQTESLDKLRTQALINLCLILLTAYNIVAFPIFYLFPNGLYYPFLQLYDHLLGATFSYCLGPGYLFQLASFVTMFPGAIFYYQVTKKFELESQTPVKTAEKLVKAIQEPIDFDKLIAEEELKLETLNDSLQNKTNKQSIGKEA